MALLFDDNTSREMVNGLDTLFLRVSKADFE